MEHHTHVPLGAAKPHHEQGSAGHDDRISLANAPMSSGRTTTSTAFGVPQKIALAGSPARRATAAPGKASRSIWSTQGGAGPAPLISTRGWSPSSAGRGIGPGSAPSRSTRRSGEG